MTGYRGICAVVPLIACLALGLGLPARASTPSIAEVHLTTEDTSAHVVVRGNAVYLTELHATQSNWNWIAGDESASAHPSDASAPAPEASTPPSEASCPFIATATVGGQPVSLTWRYVGSNFFNGPPRRYTFTFVCASPALELKSIWQAPPGGGPIEHTISIRNTGLAVVSLPLQPSLTFTARLPAGHHCDNWWVERGANRPTGTGTHQIAVTPALATDLRSLPYARDIEAERAPIPWTAVQDVEGEQGWYAGVEFSGRVHLALKAQDAGRTLAFVAGLDPAQENEPVYSTLLPAGGTFVAPTVFIGCYVGEVDDGTNRLHRWIESYLRPPVNDPNYPLLVAGTGGYGTKVDAGLMRSFTEDAAALGFEVVQLDAGWNRQVGDWRPDPAKFPAGIAPLDVDAHRRGLKFGLRIGWTQGGNERGGVGDRRPLSVVDREMTDWFTRNYPTNWQPDEVAGADVCLGDPQAVVWCLKNLDALLRECRPDLLAQDQRLIVDNCDHANHLHTGSPTDIAYQAAQGYDLISDDLRANNTSLLFEDGSNGGHTVDYGMVKRNQAIRLTGAADPLSNRRAFYDASYALPPAMCECAVEQQTGGSNTLDQFRTLLRSGMMGWCTVTCDTLHWSVEQRDAAKRQFTLYKTWLRPLIASGNLYHISERPDGEHWDGMEYYRPETGRGAVYAFRGTKEEPERRFALKGLEATAQYRVRYEDQTLPDAQLSGMELMTRGLPLRLNAPDSSELVTLERVGRS